MHRTTMVTIQALFLLLSPIALAEVSPSQVFAISKNCSKGFQPCGPAPSCCAPGLQCNYRRGIPVCQNPADNFVSGFDQEPCADPYLFRCDLVVGIRGFCCPIGTVCFNNGASKIIECIDAYGTTASSFPSATTGVRPSSTPILGNPNNITYSPAGAWGSSNSDSNCSISGTVHTTNTINASISTNFTGPSVMLHTISSPHGGVVSVWVDGFNISFTVDTYSGPGNQSLPLCYPLQLPPFVVVPPEYDTRENHTVTLVFIGPSPDAPAGTNGNMSIFQFDTFAIPDQDALFAPTSNQGPSRLHMDVVLPSMLILFSIYAMI